MAGRERLSWKEKTAIDKTADPYTMNQDHPNPPISKYDTGGPSQFAEDPDMKTPWKTEGRTETGHPAPAREAVKAAVQLEDKALKCITIAQRMLPGATDEEIEDQATDLMYIPERGVLATLQRQATLAEVLAGEKPEEEEEKSAKKKEPEEEEEEKSAKKKEPEEEEEEKSAKKKEPEEEEEEKSAKKEEATPEPEKKEEEEEEEKSAKKKEPEEEEEEEKSAKKKEPEEEEEEEKSAKKKEPEEEEEEKSAKKEEPEKKAEDEIDLTPSVDLLDSIFAKEETEKTGAKKLSGIVKKANTDITLDNLWETPPDVSKAFNQK